ncbi:MAG: hypothetical protein SCK70_00820 [bacterium]|nr:hypothetical protein [bacterium]
MYSKKIFKLTIPIICVLIVVLLVTIALAADKTKEKSRIAKQQAVTNGPIVPDNWKWHKIGTLWNRVTNFGMAGDDAYVDRSPSCDYPGGSGNSYLYRGSLWLTARVDGVVHSSQLEDHEFSPLDSVHVFTGEGTRSEQDTYTRYYDVQAPLANDHTPLGLEITERTYAWSESFRDDFIIYEYTIKNVGIDTNGDGYPDTPRDLTEFYFSYRMDADVSKLPHWPAEYRFSNQDDLGACNAFWDWIELFPEWAAVDHGLTEENADSSMMIMWDDDNPHYPADNGEDNDRGNPGPDGTLQTPGFIGFRILKTEPASFKVRSIRQNHIYNDPGTDLEAYNRMISTTEFEGPVQSGGVPFPYDYRVILSVGPLDTLAAGDSVVVTAALGIGSDPERGGIYSLMELVKNMDVAKVIVDADYQIASLAAPSPELRVEEYIQNGVVEGVKVVWDNTPEMNERFQGYKVWKSDGKTAAGAFNWQPLGWGFYADTTDSPSWPPPTGDEPNTYQIIDPNVLNGFDYYYSVQSVSYDELFGVMESNIVTNLKYISPATPPATDLSRVKVVPNPYRGSAMWNNPIPSDSEPWQHRLQFTNLPADASVKIFTLDGDFVDEIVSGDIARKTGAFEGAINMGVAEWDLITRNNQEAAPGIYLYVVDSPTAGQKVGKFVIIR